MSTYAEIKKVLESMPLKGKESVFDIRSPDYRVSTLMEVNAEDLFADESVNWRWCKAEANFSHREAAEFIVHVGDDPLEEDSYARMTVANMIAFGCTKDFIEAYWRSAMIGASRVLFYA